MATSEVDDLFECSVCMEPMLNKQPRLLVCAHTFCSPCLQQLAGQNQVGCPKCRAVTELKSGDIEDLPKNIDINNIKDLVKKVSDKISENLKTDNLCKICLKENQQKRATHVCLSCSNRPICKSCADTHGKLEALKSHQIIEIEQTHQVNPFDSIERLTCNEHKEKVEYFCRSCNAILCAFCVFNESHQVHGSDVLDFKSGFKEYKQKCSKTKFKLQKIESKFGILKKIAHSDLDIVMESKTQLAEMCETLKVVFTECECHLKKVDEQEDKVRNVCESFDDFHQKCEKVRSEWNKIRQKPEHEYIEATKSMVMDTTEILNEGKKLITAEYDLGNFVPNDLFSKECIGHFDHFVHLYRKKYNYTVTPELFKEIKPDGHFQLEEPWDLISTGHGTVFVVDHTLEILQEVDLSGEVTSSLITDTRNIFHATLFEDQIYIMFDDCESDIIEQYSVEVDVLCEVEEHEIEGIAEAQAITVGEKSIFIIEEYYISEYNFITRKKKVKVEDLPYPRESWMCSAKFHGKTRYLVADSKGGSVFVYNSCWKLQHTITKLGSQDDPLIDPHRLAVTPGGKILVSQYQPKQISMFSMNGKFICVLLKLDKKPEAIAYTSPYLWIAHNGSEPCLRIYKVGEL